MKRIAKLKNKKKNRKQVLQESFHICKNFYNDSHLWGSGRIPDLVQKDTRKKETRLFLQMKPTKTKSVTLSSYEFLFIFLACFCFT